MHTYSLLTKSADLESTIVPVLMKNGSEIPDPSCYVAAVEFDEAGQVVAYQLMQNAVFLEGIWARDSSAHLLTLYRMALRYLGALNIKSAMTMTRNDNTGNRIGRIAEALGFEKKDWNVYRRGN